MDDKFHVWLFLVFLANWHVLILAELRLVRTIIYIYPRSETPRKSGLTAISKADYPKVMKSISQSSVDVEENQKLDYP